MLFDISYICRALHRNVSPYGFSAGDYCHIFSSISGRQQAPLVEVLVYFHHLRLLLIWLLLLLSSILFDALIILPLSFVMDLLV